MIRNQWYAVLDCQEVKRGKPLGVKRMGERMVFWRDEDNVVTCMVDQCVHRGAALSSGRIVRNAIQCPFHGFEYDQKGRCRCIPANGKSIEVPAAFLVKTYPAREEQGFIWIWWGEIRTELPPLPIFPDLDGSYSLAGIKDQWSVDYTRAIENQLDVFHLPFVHASTIGRGARTISDGPVTKLDHDRMEIWVYSRKEDGTGSKRTGDLQQPQKPPQLIFHFPNTWMNRISKDIRLIAGFAPVDEGTCVIYIHQYQRLVNLPLARELFNFIGMIANRIILNQDKRVVLSQLPKKVNLISGEKLISQDRPIILFRTRRRDLVEQNEPNE